MILFSQFITVLSFILRLVFSRIHSWIRWINGPRFLAATPAAKYCHGSVSLRLKAALIAVASDSDFLALLRAGSDLRALAATLSQPGWSLYSAGARVATFVQCDPALRLDVANPFYYIAQYTHARRVLHCRLADLPALVDLLGLPARLPRHVVLIPSTGRCGSTLLSAVFSAASPSFTSLSEPDVFTCLHELLRAHTDPRPPELEALVRAVVPLVCLPYLGSDAVFIKTRAPFGYCAQLAAAQPALRFLFMYRDCAPFATSWLTVFSTTAWFAAFMLESTLKPMRLAEGSGEEYTRNAHPEKRRRHAQLQGLLELVRQSNPREHPEQYAVLFWAGNVAKYIDDLQLGLPIAAIRHEALVAQPEASLQSIFAFLGITLSPAMVASALTAFQSDSQEGSSLAQNRHNEDRRVVAQKVRKAIDELTPFLSQNYPLIPSFDNCILPNVL